MKKKNYPYFENLIFRVRVKPKVRSPGVDFTDENELLVRIKAPPEKGKANEEWRSLLASYFGCFKEAVRIKSGFNSSWKIVVIEGFKEEKEFAAGGKK